VNVFVDGTNVGSPGAWNHRPDLDALFPASTYPGISSALDIFGLDTTTLSNGVHTIFWIVTGTGGSGTSVIGSRFFTVSNGSETLDPNARAAASSRSIVIASNPALDAPASRIASPQALEAEIAAAPIEVSSVEGRRGFDLDRALQTYTPSGGRLDVQAEELDRIDRTQQHGRSPVPRPPATRRHPAAAPVGRRRRGDGHVHGHRASAYGGYADVWAGATAAQRRRMSGSRCTRRAATGSARRRSSMRPVRAGPGRRAFYVGGWAADPSRLDSGVNAARGYLIDTAAKRSIRSSSVRRSTARVQT
jgi:hypothetical protein